MGKYERQRKAVEVEQRELAQKAQAIMDRAENEGRPLSDEEDTDVKGLLAKNEILKEKKREIDVAIETRQRVEEVGSLISVDEAPAGEKQDRPSSIGDAFVKSAGYKAVRQDGFNGKWSTGPVEIELKALLDSAGVGSEDSGLLQTQDLPGIQSILFQRLTVADLMASGTASSSSIRYMVESTATNAAAGVAEGAPKPESTLAFNATDEPVKKIATLLPVTDEMLEDVAALRSYIDGRLRLFVQMEEERQLLAGAGGDDLAGLIGRLPGANTAVRAADVGATNFDHIHAGITLIRAAFLEPDGIVIHPGDWAALERLKANDEYIGGGPFGTNPFSLWGKRVVVTSAITEGRALVGAFRTASQVFRKGGVSVEASNSHSDFFASNKTAIRAEERLALAVYRPEAFAQIDLDGVGLTT